MRSNFFNIVKMQVSALSQIVWLQLLCIVLYPMFFSNINAANDQANTIIYATGLLLLPYLTMRNFAFNDAKYKTRLLFGILPIMPETLIQARGAIVYLSSLIATPFVLLFSNIIHLIKPDMFAAVSIHIVPYGLLLFSIFLPIEFLIFYLFDAQKADIIAALACFPYMGLMFVFYKYLRVTPFWMIAIILAVFSNVVCYITSQNLYKSQRV